MSYNPVTDFLGLYRKNGGVLNPLEMPGLDFYVAAFARMGFITLSVGQTAPVVNQETTVWFQPALPTYSAEGITWLWNANTSEYELATPSLWGQFLNHLSVSNAVAPLLVQPTLAAFRAAAGLGSIATQDASAVAITGGAIGGAVLSGVTIDGNSVINGMFGDVVTTALTNAPVTIASPAAVNRFTGVLTADVTVTIPLTGYFIAENLCTGAHVVKLASSTPGKIVCAPPGEAVHVYCDGVDMHYVNLGRIGAALLLTATGVPAWVTSCTVPPYLIADGSNFSALTYPTLNTLLSGTTLPDLRGRAWWNLNGGTGRLVASGGFGFNGDVLFAAGGSVTLNQVQLPNVNWTVSDPTHNHSIASNYLINSGGAGTAGGGNLLGVISGGSTAVAATNISVNSGGSGFPLLPPGAVGGITLIRAG